MKHLLWMLLLTAGMNAWTQVPYPSAPPVATFSKAEYFFDTDPGFGNGVPIALNSVPEISSLTHTLSANLASGIHRLYIRAQDVQGRWSFTASQVFDNYIVPVYPTGTAQPAITAMEYFIDSDPGFGNGQVLPTGSSSVQVPVSSVAPGTHRLYIRTKDNTGRWSFVAYAVFDNTTVLPYPAAAPPAALTDLEYFIDSDPGLGKGTAVSLPVSTDVANFQFTVPVTALPEGSHTIYVRSKNNPYSLTAYVEFLKGTPLPLTWLYVKGEARNDEHLISWGTANEVNVSHFEIEHSTDGIHYAVIGKVNAYRFVNGRPAAGWNYYRVVEHDHDGYTSRSKVITLLNNDGLDKTFITPNPFTDRLNIATDPQEAGRRIIVYSANGRQVMDQPISGQYISLNTAALAPGTYFVKIIYAHKEATYKVLRK